MNVKRGATSHLRKGWGAMEGGPRAQSGLMYDLETRSSAPHDLRSPPTPET